MTRPDFIHAKISVAEVESLHTRITELETRLAERNIALAKQDTEIANFKALSSGAAIIITELEKRLSASLRYARSLEVAAVDAVIPLEAMNISGMIKQFDAETANAIQKAISSVRTAITDRPKTTAQRP